MDFKEAYIYIHDTKDVLKQAQHFFPFHKLDVDAFNSYDKLFKEEYPTIECPGDKYIFINPLLSTTINISDTIIFDENINPHNDYVGKKFYPDWFLKAGNYPQPSIADYEKWFEFLHQGDSTELGIIKKQIDLSYGAIRFEAIFLNDWSTYFLNNWSSYDNRNIKR